MTLEWIPPCDAVIAAKPESVIDCRNRIFNDGVLDERGVVSAERCAFVVIARDRSEQAPIGGQPLLDFAQFLLQSRYRG